MKALMLGASLAALLGAPALAQSYDQSGADPYYDQQAPQRSQPPPGNDRQDGDYGQSQAPYDQQYGDQQYGDQDENGADDADQGYGQYQPPPAPPPGEPGFQNYQGAPQNGYAPNGEAEPDYGQSPPRYGYQGGGAGEYAAPQYGYPGAYGQSGATQYGYGYAAPPGSYGATAAARPTGRTGPSWRNGEGQYCVWREMTWQDRYGRPAYRWVPRCR